MMENESKSNRQGNCFSRTSALEKEPVPSLKEEELELDEVLKLKGDLFGRRKEGVRPYCKTDRI